MASRRRVAWTPEARRTLEEIIEFIAQDSPEGARRVLEQALSAAASLQTLAQRGRIVPERGDPRIREIFVYRYRLMYRVAADSVVILAFIHGARDFAALAAGPVNPRPNKRLQPTAAPGAVPDRGTLGGVIQAPQRGCGAASAAEAPHR